MVASFISKPFRYSLLYLLSDSSLRALPLRLLRVSSPFTPHAFWRYVVLTPAPSSQARHSALFVNEWTLHHPAVGELVILPSRCVCCLCVFLGVVFAGCSVSVCSFSCRSFAFLVSPSVDRLFFLVDRFSDAGQGVSVNGLVTHYRPPCGPERPGPTWRVQLDAKDEGPQSDRVSGVA